MAQELIEDLEPRVHATRYAPKENTCVIQALISHRTATGSMNGVGVGARQYLVSLAAKAVKVHGR